MDRKDLKPVELENNLGPDVNGVIHRVPWKAYDIEEDRGCGHCQGRERPQVQVRHQLGKLRSNQ